MMALRSPSLNRSRTASAGANSRAEVASRVPGEVPGRPTLPEVIVAAEGEIFEL